MKSVAYRWSLIAVLVAVGPAILLHAGQQSPAPPVGVAASAAAAPQLLAIRASVDRQAVTLALEIGGAFTYTPTAAGPHLLLVDLPGVFWKESSSSRLLDSPLVSSYRAVSYLREAQPSVRIELLLKSPVKADYHRSEGRLEIVLSPPGTSAVAAKGASLDAPESVPDSAVRASRLEKVAMIKSADSVRVQVMANGRLQYKAFELKDPRRLVLDMPDVVSHVARQELPDRVRVGQFRERPPVARVVLDLETQARYDVRSGIRGLEIELRNSGSAGATSPTRALAPVPPAPKISAAMPAAVDAVFSSVRQLMASPRVELAEQASRPAPAVAAKGASLEAVAQAPVQAALRTPAQAPAQAPVAQPMQAKPAMQSPTMPTSSKRYTGELISINVKDVDIKDFFRLIHEISGLNVILDSQVNGRLTMVLDDVPWDQALDIVLKNFQLDSVLEGNVLRIATLDTLKKEQEAIAGIAKAQAATVELVTVTRSVNYAKAQDVATTLKKFLTERSQVIADERTNTLIITDIPQSIPLMDSVLVQLDKRTQQVEIEARVVAASRSFSRELGFQLGFATIFGSHTVIGGNPVGSSGSPITSRTPAPVFSVSGGQAIPLFSNFPAAGATSGFTLSTNTGGFSLDAIITAAENRGIGKLLSRPKVVTQNNRQALVQQGVKIPVQTTINNTVSTQFVDATLSMTVTPQITAESTIFLEVDVKNTSIDPGIARINGIPALDTQQATTRVLVDNGGTVVFGGVIQTMNNLTVQQVPLLGSIPVVGNLFKRTGITTSTNELLFFISPKII